MTSATFFHTVRTVICVASLTMLCWGRLRSGFGIAGAEPARDRLLFASSLRSSERHSRDVGSSTLDQSPVAIAEVHRLIRRNQVHPTNCVRTTRPVARLIRLKVDPLVQHQDFTADDETMALITEGTSAAPRRTDRAIVEHDPVTTQGARAANDDCGQASCWLAMPLRKRTGLIRGTGSLPKTGHLAKLNCASLILSQPGRFQFLVGGLKPVKDLLIEELSDAIAMNVKRNESDRSVAANILIEYATDRPDHFDGRSARNTKPDALAGGDFRRAHNRGPTRQSPGWNSNLRSVHCKILRTTWNDEPLRSILPVDPATAVASR